MKGTVPVLTQAEGNTEESPFGCKTRVPELIACAEGGVTTPWRCRSCGQVLWALQFPHSELKNIYTVEAEELRENNKCWSFI